MHVEGSERPSSLPPAPPELEHEHAHDTIPAPPSWAPLESERPAKDWSPE